jgi:Cu-Zn family superoxide dismutase
MRRCGGLPANDGETPMSVRTLVFLAALAAAPVALAQPASVTADIKNAAGQTVGAVTATAAPKGVILRIEAKGLAPGWHGVHLHEKGDCSKSDFTTAGGHIHGAGAGAHGLLNPAANDMGDLPNLKAAADGMASAEMFTPLVTLAQLRDADGSALVIHASPDDYMSQPIGGAGARVACAVIR